jgi:hypothetical protein
VRLVVITGEYPHHKNLCAAIHAKHELVGIYHPRTPRPGSRQRLRKLWRELFEFGAVYEVTRLAVKLPQPFRGWDVKWKSKAFHHSERESFPYAEEAYRRIPQKLIHFVSNINSPETVKKISDLEPDAVLCLGGPVYRQPLIEAVPIMLNFHTGFSPLYNGADTISFAFANGHINLCGGTMMVMSEKVDAGDILAHYLPAIEPGDTPTSVSMRIFAAVPRVYLDFLTHLAGGKSFARCTQPPALFYCRGRDWTVVHAKRAQRYIRDNLAARYQRPERYVTYWNQSDEGAQALMRDTINEAMELI